MAFLLRIHAVVDREDDLKACLKINGAIEENCAFWSVESIPVRNRAYLRYLKRGGKLSFERWNNERRLLASLYRRHPNWTPSNLLTMADLEIELTGRERPTVFAHRDDFARAAIAWLKSQ